MNFLYKFCALFPKLMPFCVLLLITEMVDFEFCKEWLEAGKLQRVVLVIMSKATNEVLERWNFSIETDSEVVEKG